jgi:hypothetical protein
MLSLAPLVFLTGATATADAAPPERCDVAADIRTSEHLPADWSDTLGELLAEEGLTPDGACVRVRRRGGGTRTGVLEETPDGFAFFADRVRIHPQDTVVVSFHGSDFNAAAN